ncbi:MAG: winged helix-turn-helix domain-containing protein, partial [Oscillospiraceae bacterium]|nr:winged helix-turn-helix domain-containing protein [Oscillospiraceae bacterium]
MENPGFQEYMYPILDYLKNGDVRSKREICDEMANRFQLSDELKEETLPSQTQPTYINRIGWAITYLKK